MGEFICKFEVGKFFLSNSLKFKFYVKDNRRK